MSIEMRIGHNSMSLASFVVRRRVASQRPHSMMRSKNINAYNDAYKHAYIYSYIEILYIYNYLNAEKGVFHLMALEISHLEGEARRTEGHTYRYIIARHARCN